jgi:hypothetical protein
MQLSVQNMSKRAFGFFAVVMLVSVTSVLGQSPPANDSFANRTVLTGASLTITGTLAEATLESAETNYPFSGYSLGGSVWWTWTPPDSTTVVIAMLRNYSLADTTNTGLFVYAGTNLSALTELDFNSFDGPAGRYVAFAATAGTSYQFRMTGNWRGTFQLKLTATNPPVFLRQPKDYAASPHGSAFFSAIAVGLPSYTWLHPSTTYQWTFNGAPIPNETGASVLIHNVTTNQAGGYSVIASNVGGITESAVARLTVIDTNPVPRLAALSPGNPALLSFSLTGEGGRWYKIESSQDLQNWVSPSWVQSTNESSVVSVPRLGPTHFVRASLNVPTDVCVAQLKQMRAAQDVFAIESRQAWWSTVSLDEIKHYLPLDAYENIKPCPEGGDYITPSTIIESITCSIHGRGHQSADP